MALLNQPASIRRPRRAVVRLLAAVALLWLASAGGGRVQAQPSEYDLKAVLLFHLAQFTEWPASAFAATNSPIVIGVLGDDPFGKVLDEIVRGERIGGREVTVQRLDTIPASAACHILFIAQSEESRVESFLRQMQTRPVLTVSDTERFSRRGGMVRFEMVDKRVRLRVNARAVREAALSLSSKVLRLAEIDER